MVLKVNNKIIQDECLLKGKQLWMLALSSPRFCCVFSLHGSWVFLYGSSKALMFHQRQYWSHIVSLLSVQFVTRSSILSAKETSEGRLKKGSYARRLHLKRIQATDIHSRVAGRIQPLRSSSNHGTETSSSTPAAVLSTRLQDARLLEVIVSKSWSKFAFSTIP